MVFKYHFLDIPLAWELPGDYRGSSTLSTFSQVCVHAIPTGTFSQALRVCIGAVKRLESPSFHHISALWYFSSLHWSLGTHIKTLSSILKECHSCYSKNSLHLLLVMVIISLLQIDMLHIRINDNPGSYMDILSSSGHLIVWLHKPENGGTQKHKPILLFLLVTL